MPFLSLAQPLLGVSVGAGSGTSTLVVIAIGVLVAWLLSLLLHPFTACSSCKGSPKSYGAVATKSFRTCGACGGSGKQLRMGAGLWSRNRE
ncbi:hypothetical protein [Pseudonocardia nigra]|uniref:hypothetical protein n=1 Tax=Pseudonocardia nigra TaxID=1921578 RepID=UPI001C5D81CF|nr:hypothetical protein [Pseudonocardia nigra]